VEKISILETKQAMNVVGKKRLAELTGVRPSTIKFYSEIGLLPYKQVEGGLARRYDRQEASRRLGEIKQLRESGLSISDMRECLRG
jgi:DNA-binding transcriptional MerR regulator